MNRETRYLRLDLKPTNGKDYKTHVERMARELSIKRNENISVTKYIQELIEADMKKAESKGNNLADVLAKIEKLDKEQMKAIKLILNAFTK